MSTDYHLACQDCQEHSSVDVAIEQKLVDVFYAWPHIQAILDLNSWSINVEILGVYEQEELFDFLRLHYGHHLMIYDEYGRPEPIVLEYREPVQ